MASAEQEEIKQFVKDKNVEKREKDLRTEVGSWKEDDFNQKMGGGWLDSTSGTPNCVVGMMSKPACKLSEITTGKTASLQRAGSSHGGDTTRFVMVSLHRENPVMITCKSKKIPYSITILKDSGKDIDNGFQIRVPPPQDIWNLLSHETETPPPAAGDSGRLTSPPKRPLAKRKSSFGGRMGSSMGGMMSMANKAAESAAAHSSTAKKAMDLAKSNTSGSEAGGKDAVFEARWHQEFGVDTGLKYGLGEFKLSGIEYVYGTAGSADAEKNFEEAVASGGDTLGGSP